MLYQALVKPLLFRMDPEDAHHLALKALGFACRAPFGAVAEALFGTNDRRHEKKLWGLTFKNPVGLAAGFDKNALVVPALARLGFGFLEVGAVSSAARPGNPRPRIFRLPDDRGLINRMGLPNDGCEAIGKRLQALRGRVPVPLFANIVKTSDLVGDTQTMAADYVTTLRAILPHVDGVTVNVSCPATPELKAFNKADAMFGLLEILAKERTVIAPAAGGTAARPMLLKVSPDIDLEEREVIVAAAHAGLLDGLVLTNTTTTRPRGLEAPAKVVAERGGLSGKPLQGRSIELIGWYAERVKVPIVGVGGIFSAADAKAAMAAGAQLVEVYTGFVYEGPALIKRIVRGL